jgi:hypothetical protein
MEGVGGRKGVRVGCWIADGDWLFIIRACAYKSKFHSKSLIF